jgi:UDP-N-acetylmuramate dehydrogenase
MKGHLLRKKETQPVGKPNAGSVFKNPEGMPAWKLIDSVGMRGASVGEAAVSQRHTNFIINNGGAKATDVLSLIRLVGSKVERETGVTLELEVRIVGV